jgi:methylmalonyl-CoA/ethylmalonyl-CoA epimerase
MFDQVDHIAIAVEDIDSSLDLYSATFGMSESHRELVEDFNVEIATINVGDTAIELIKPTNDASPIRKFLDERGPGIHHIAFRVDDIRTALSDLEKKGAELIDKSPRKGKDGSLVAFIHPRSTGHVLYELVQTKG